VDFFAGFAGAGHTCSAVTVQELPPVDVLIAGPDATRRVQLRHLHVDHTIRDLLRCEPTLRGSSGETLIVDNVIVSAGALVRDVIHHGSLLEPVAVTAGGDSTGLLPHRSHVEITWLTGPDSGRMLLLGAGRHLIGTAPGSTLTTADELMARSHGLLIVSERGVATYEDFGIGRPSRLNTEPFDGRVELASESRLDIGGSTLIVRPLAGRTGPTVSSPRQPGSTNELTTQTPATTSTWQRSVVRLAETPEIAMPAVTLPPSGSAGQPGGVSAIGLITAGVSVLGGGVLAFVLKQPLMLVMVGLGAVGTLVTWAAQAITARKRGRRQTAAERKAWAAFSVELLTAHEIAQVHAAARRQLTDAVAAIADSQGLWSSPQLTASLGIGALPWSPAKQDAEGQALDTSRGRIDPAIAATLDEHSMLCDVPVHLDVAAGQTVGVVGEASRVTSLVRSMIVQLAAAQGPSQWRLTIVAGAAVHEWTWAQWLAHTEDGSAEGSLVVGACDALVRQRLTADTAAGERELDRLEVIVVLDPSVLTHRTSELRRLLATDATRCALIVLGETLATLPPSCTDVIEVGSTEAVWTKRSSGTTPIRFRPAGCSVETAARAARLMARWSDPELVDVDGGTPPAVDALELFGARAASAAAVAAGWSAVGRDPAPSAVIGVARDGVVDIDLDRDGPHALVAGTTGAGKSELLRTLIAGLALSAPPEHLQLLLVDYKGGSAFDACAGLPHVAGVVTDLDDRLAERVLRSLNAELVRRERMLRAAAAENLNVFRAGGGTLARLVIIIDEFAALASELPDFLPSIVDVARRGRSLGVHLVLATQRPAGVVSDDIRANTNLRIGLRLQDTADSIDVVGSAEASGLPRNRPGRAVLRFGADELVTVQVARCTGPAPTNRVAGLEVVAHADGAADDGRPVTTADGGDSTLTSLDVLVERIRQAARVSGSVVPERPWLPPLPVRLDAAHVESGALGTVDDPEHQSQHPLTWHPSQGHLVVVGSLGSGTSTALATVATRLAVASSATDLHLYILEQGSTLAPLVALPHCGGRVNLGETDRVSRLLDLLADELDERLANDRADQSQIIVLVDGGAALRQYLLDHEHVADAERFERIASSGPQVGIVIVLAADQSSSAPNSVISRSGERWVLSLNDPFDATMLGVEPRRALTGAPAGRGIAASTGREFQLVHPGDLAEAVATCTAAWQQSAGVATGPRQLPTTPTLVLATEINHQRCTTNPVDDGEDELRLAIGLEVRRLHQRSLNLRAGDHALIAGSARSGRTSLLALLATEFRDQCPTGWLGVVPGRRAGSLDSVGADVVGTLAEVLAAMPSAQRGLLLIDDAEQVDDVEGRLAAVLGSSRDVQVIAAGRTDGLRSNYGHWTAQIRRQRRGLLLGVTHDLDADLFSAMLPRHSAGQAIQGRGWLVQDGVVEAVQVGLLDALAA
jgi:DNA segregation ATPase FtsK/SpoIIIE, S-DNA-T family